MKRKAWYLSSGYKHLDVPVGEAFAAETENPGVVSRHSWLPLIRYIRRVKRYKPKLGQTVFKDRPIMYASHRDACILKRYARDLTVALDKHYVANGLDNGVIGYRKLGKANYHFSADAYRFAVATMPCKVLCFDITSFFDSLDHRILKDRLKRILAVKELTQDWYNVFRAVTQYRAIERDHLEQHAVFGQRLATKNRQPIATIAEIRAAGITITPNPNKFGIPQGTPISSAFSNLYLMDFDRMLIDACAVHGALYRRYSDDILVICPVGTEVGLSAIIQKCLAEHHLSLAADKSYEQLFDPDSFAEFQYLGFNISPEGAVIRQSSLARQWRKFKRAINSTRKAGLMAISQGKANKIYVSKLRKRFSPVGARNFSSYARRAGEAFGSRKIGRQVSRLERRTDAAIRALQKP
jgi:RNA-directed DNA polymerase